MFNVVSVSLSFSVMYFLAIAVLLPLEILRKLQ